MTPTQHLRSTNKPEFSTTSKGRIVVWTECGQQVDAVIVDNEHTDCPACAATEA